MKKILLALAIVVFSFPVTVSAQTVINPSRVEFTASADHSVVGIDGAPIVVKYELRISLETGGPVLFVTDIGKPTPVANVISVANVVWFAGLTPNTKYLARVAAIGASGEGVSDPSNPFGNVPAPQKPTVVSVKK